MTISKCHNAPVTAFHGCDSDGGHMGKACTCSEVTMWYVCSECLQACDVVEEYTNVKLTEKVDKFKSIMHELVKDIVKSTCV